MESVFVAGKTLPLQTENYAFLGKLTEFDPLPEHDHPYFEINTLPFVELDHLTEAFEIKGLK
jgi:alpha-glucosidase